MTALRGKQRSIKTYQSENDKQYRQERIIIMTNNTIMDMFFNTDDNGYLYINGWRSSLFLRISLISKPSPSLISVQ